MSHQTGVTHSSEGLKNVSHGAYDIYGYLDPRRLIFSSLLTYVLALRSFSLSKQRSSILSIILFSIIIIFNDFQTSARKEIKRKVPRNQKEQRCQSKLGSNQSTSISNINAEYIQIHKQLGIYSKTRQLSSIFVHINKRTTTSLFTFNSN